MTPVEWIAAIALAVACFGAGISYGAYLERNQ